MFKSLEMFVLVFVLLMFQSMYAVADRTHDGWDIHVNGYAELDSVFDSTRTYTEQLTAAPVIVPGTAGGGGDTGRTQMSARQSRLYLKVNAPEQDGWKTRGLLETDFFGVDPSPQGTTNVSQSEQGFYISGTLRMRNAFGEVSKDGWHILAGQNWTTFGYQPYFEILNTSTQTPIDLIQRAPQVKVTKDLTFGDSFNGQADIEIDKPTQRDSTIPNLDLGARLNWTGRKAGLLHGTGAEWSMEPTSLAISGTVREYSTPNSDGNVADKTTYMGGGLAVSAIAPILTGDGTSNKNNLIFVGEYVNGSGIGDNYVGWSGNQSSLVTGAGTLAPGVSSLAMYPNLDAGIAGYDSSGNFQLINTQEYTAELQYILPTDTTMAVNLEYARLHSSNVVNLQTTSNAGIPAAGFYDYNEMYGVDFVYDFSPNVRVIAEYNRMLTHYASGAYPVNNRYAVSTFFMF